MKKFNLFNYKFIHIHIHKIKFGKHNADFSFDIFSNYKNLIGEKVFLSLLSSYIKSSAFNSCLISSKI